MLRHLSPLECLPPELYHQVLSLLETQDLRSLYATSTHLASKTSTALGERPTLVRLSTSNLGAWAQAIVKDPTFERPVPWRRVKVSAGISCPLPPGWSGVVPSSLCHSAISPWHAVGLPRTIRHLTMTPDGFDGHTDLYLSLLADIPNHFPDLLSLDVSWNDDSRGAPPLHIDFARLPLLRRLCIWYYQKPTCLVDLSGLSPHITSLSLLGVYHMSHADIASIILPLRDLVELEIAGCPQGSTGIILQALAHSNPRHLRHLMLDEMMAGMEELDLQAVESLHEGLSSLSRLGPPLPIRTLHLRGMSGWDSVLHIPLLHAAFASSIRHLSLMCLPEVQFPGRLVWSYLRRLDLREVNVLSIRSCHDKPLFPHLLKISLSKIYHAHPVQAKTDPVPRLLHVDITRDVAKEVIGLLLQHDIYTITGFRLPIDRVVFILDQARKFRIEVMEVWKDQDSDKSMIDAYLEEHGQGKIVALRLP